MIICIIYDHMLYIIVLLLSLLMRKLKHEMVKKFTKYHIIKTEETGLDLEQNNTRALLLTITLYCPLTKVLSLTF